MAVLSLCFLCFGATSGSLLSHPPKEPDYMSFLSADESETEKMSNQARELVADKRRAPVALMQEQSVAGESVSAQEGACVQVLGLLSSFAPTVAKSVAHIDGPRSTGGKTMQPMDMSGLLALESALVQFAAGKPPAVPSVVHALASRGSQSLKSTIAEAVARILEALGIVEENLGMTGKSAQEIIDNHKEPFERCESIRTGLNVQVTGLLTSRNTQYTKMVNSCGGGGGGPTAVPQITCEWTVKELETAKTSICDL